MNLAEPSDVAMSRATAAVLRVVIDAEASFSIRQISRVANIAFPQALRIVNHESARGLILIEQAGRSKMCRFNREHLAAGAVVELIRLRDRIIQVIEDEILTWITKPIHSSLFGSAARGEGGPDSDLDVLIIRPDEVPQNEWEEQKYLSGLRLKTKTGNTVSWFDISITELKTASKGAEPIFAEWKRDGIPLSGSLLSDLLPRTKRQHQR